MSPLALVPNGALVAQPDCIGSTLTTKPSLRLRKRRIKLTRLKLPAIMALALAALILVAALPYAAQAAPPGIWSPIGSLGTARYKHTATLLANGQVLVAGGYNGNFFPQHLDSAELYTAGTWSPTGSLNVRRKGHTATLLPDGRVLVAGGIILTAAATLTASSASIRPRGSGPPPTP
jgi:hypothetical protein